MLVAATHPLFLLPFAFDSSYVYTEVKLGKVVAAPANPLMGIPSLLKSSNVMLSTLLVNSLHPFIEVDKYCSTITSPSKGVIKGFELV